LEFFGLRKGKMGRKHVGKAKKKKKSLLSSGAAVPPLWTRLPPCRNNTGSSLWPEKKTGTPSKFSFGQKGRGERGEL